MNCVKNQRKSQLFYGLAEQQAVKEYLLDGIPYRTLAKKYGVSRSTINKWVLVYQGIHNIPRSHKQISYDLQQKSFEKNQTTHCTLPLAWAYGKSWAQATLRIVRFNLLTFVFLPNFSFD
jgi:transposase